MARTRTSNDEVYKGATRPPATTVEGREKQMINLTLDVVERQLRSGEASAQVLTHYLKLATVKEEMERDNLRAQNKLLEARVQALASSANSEELAKKAIEAFTSYRPSDPDPEDYVD